jgi:CHAD domain-containing protein
MYLETSHSENAVTLLRSSKNNILKLARIRLKKCVSIAPRLLVDDDPDDIHDLRVTSRRLQQVVSLMFPKPRRAKSRKVIRSLRDLRRDWSACRNLDVNLALLQEKLESLETDGVRDAWDYVRGCLVELRAQELDRARKRLRRLDILAFIERTQRLFKAGKIENLQDLNLEESFADTLAEWHEAVAQAKSRQNPKHLHELRISGKRLRYGLEIIAELGDTAAKEQVTSLKGLQDELGRWHDCHVLLQYVEELIENTEFASDRPEFQQILERDIDGERRKNNAAMDEILKEAEKLQLGFASKEAAVTSEDSL